MSRVPYGLAFKLNGSLTHEKGHTMSVRGDSAFFQNDSKNSEKPADRKKLIIISVQKVPGVPDGARIIVLGRSLYLDEINTHVFADCEYSSKCSHHAGMQNYRAFSCKACKFFQTKKG
jgi:hypothetical protein